MMFQVCLFIFSTVISTIAGTTTISPGTTLYASHTTQLWSSPNNTFSLHFLPLHPQTSPPSFIAAIVYSGGSPLIWSAGNGTTVDSGGSLQFLPAGNLRLVNGSGSTVWDSGTSNMGVSSAMLHDNGNLVLSNGTDTVWSSFDNPTDTIVPTQNFTVGPGTSPSNGGDSVPYWEQGLNSSMSLVNLSSPVLGLQPVGILQLFDPKLIAPVMVAYSDDYNEGNDDMLRILKLDGDGNLRIYSSKKGSGTVTVRWVAVEDQCEVFGYCGNNGICSYNNSNPICGCPSQNFEMVDPNDSRKGCMRKVRLEDCEGKVAMLQVDHARFLTYPPQFMINPEIFFIGISACRGNCLSASSCFGSTSLSDGTGLCYIKTSNFISGYQNPALPSTSYIKVCGPLAPNSPPSLENAGEGKDRRIHAWIVAVVVLSTLLAFLAFEGGLWLWCCRNSPGLEGLAAQYALLEYASGAPVHFSYKELQRKKFSIWAYEEFEKGNIMGVIDRRMVSQEVNLEQAKRVLLACFWCIQEQPSQRPTMGKVVQMLEGVIDIDRPPAPKLITVGSSGGINGSVTPISTIATSPSPTFSPSSSLLT
ncbi:S-locus glycoprotein domain [Sesbania bispinosa]|nr:S-locus glycoprotein domain [Sesbania bispinosa]